MVIAEQRIPVKLHGAHLMPHASNFCHIFYSYLYTTNAQTFWTRKMSVSIYYDGDCPVCNNYVGFLRLKETVGMPELIDLREDADACARMIAAGYDVDSGMVAEIDGTTYHGGDAVHALALLSSPSGVLNRMNAFLFSSGPVARISYPVLRAGRNLLLILLARDPITAEDADQMAKYKLFALMFGLFTVFHFISFIGHYATWPSSVDLYLLGLSGMLMVFNPGSKRIFLLLAVMSLVSGWVQAPIASNHAMLSNYIILCFMVVFMVDMLRGKSWSRIFADFAPVGCTGLLVMYFFGVFHKINTGFLDPEVSCAVFLWRQMPFFASPLDSQFFHQAAIWGTYIVETALLIGLLIPRWRHFAVVGGIAFHLMLALSNYSYYLPFTTLSICAHLLFLSPQGARAVLDSPIMLRQTALLRSPMGIVAGILYFCAIAWLVKVSRDYSLATIAAMALIAPILVTIARLGGAKQKEPLMSGRISIGFATVLGVIFFLNSMSPYFGLKSAQTINMFANLRLEGGVSNHLVFQKTPSMFGYLQDLVELEKVEGHDYLDTMRRANVGLVYHDLLADLVDNPGAKVSYLRGGIHYTDQTAKTLQADVDAILLPKIARKFFFFAPVILNTPPRCL